MHRDLKLCKHQSICLIVHFVTNIVAENFSNIFLKFQFSRKKTLLDGFHI